MRHGTRRCRAAPYARRDGSPGISNSKESTCPSPVVRQRAVLLSMTGCLAASPAEVPPSASAAPPAPSSASQSAEPSDDEIVALLVRADALEYLNDAGDPVAGARDAYVDGAETAIARLTDLLGEPTTETYESRYTPGAGTLHRWDGIAVDVFPAEMVAETPGSPSWGVRLESNTAAGLALATVDGLAVGDPVPTGLETSACGSPMSEVVDGIGVEIHADAAGAAVDLVRSPVFTDACE